MDIKAITTTIQKLLESYYWIPTLSTDKSYFRQHDDTDGKADGVLQINFDRFGDAWISIDGRKMLRFRTGCGGGSSLRTRNALMILAEAIRLDNEEKPQNI